jgi:TPR repeat protein
MGKKQAWNGHTRARVEELREAAAAGDRDALVELACLYDDGSARDANGTLVVKRDRPRARKYYARAAELGDPAAMTVMADKLTPKGHDERALAQAEKLYRRAFRLGYETAAENLAATYQNLGRYREAVRWYRRAAAAGSPTAPLELARAELYGAGTRRNVRAAFVRLERLARQRLGWNNWLRVEAMHLMADALMNGWLVRRDYSRGEALLRQAAKLDPATTTRLVDLAEPAGPVSKTGV